MLVLSGCARTPARVCKECSAMQPHDRSCPQRAASMIADSLGADLFMPTIECAAEPWLNQTRTRVRRALETGTAPAGSTG
jgi:hypothetical protein